MEGLEANFEFDLKRIIGVPTLRQLFVFVALKNTIDVFSQSGSGL